MTDQVQSISILSVSMKLLNYRNELAIAIITRDVAKQELIIWLSKVIYIFSMINHNMKNSQYWWWMDSLLVGHNSTAVLNTNIYTAYLIVCRILFVNHWLWSYQLIINI